jgi:hypothetical protein
LRPRSTATPIASYRVDFAKLSLRELDILATSPTREVRIAAKTERTRRSLKKR